MQVNEAIFRDYDIRGIVGKDLDEKLAYVFGQAPWDLFGSKRR